MNDEFERGRPEVISTPSRWQAYLRWRDEQVCKVCGKEYRDRQEGEVWANDTLCWSCFEQRCLNTEKDRERERWNIQIAIVEELENAWAADDFDQFYAALERIRQLSNQSRKGV